MREPPVLTCRRMSGRLRVHSRRGIAIAAAGAMIVLLGVLATLQYRWIGEVSAAELDRLRATAVHSAEAVAADFDADIARVVHHFGIPQGEIDPVRYVANSARTWSANVRYPEIVHDLYLASRDPASGDVVIARIDFSSARSDPTAWPAALAAVRAEIGRANEAPPPSERNPGFSGRIGSSGTFFRRPGVEIFDEIPALVIPPGPPRTRANPGVEASPPPFPGPSPWVIVSFDRHALVDVLLARLVNREFGSASDLDVAVIRRVSPEDIVFRSRGDFVPAAARAIDAEAPLFSIRPGGSVPVEPALRPRRREFAGRGGGAGAWTLVVAHRSGTLQETVEASRRRNLAVSAGILLLLAASIATLLLSAHRAQRLAHQQIEFVAGITHELRTPLAAIRSAGQNLADGVVADPERVRRYGSLVVREGRRLSGPPSPRQRPHRRMPTRATRPPKRAQRSDSAGAADRASPTPPLSRRKTAPSCTTGLRRRPPSSRRSARRSSASTAETMRASLRRSLPPRRK